MEQIFKITNSDKKKILVILIFSLGILFFNQFEGYRQQQILIEKYGDEQLLLVKQGVFFLEALGKNNSNHSAEVLTQLTSYMENNITSGSRYWILCEGNRILYLKNDELTKRYVNTPINDYFSNEGNVSVYEKMEQEAFFNGVIEDKSQGKLMVSMGKFRLLEQSYTLMLCTKEMYIFTESQFMEHYTYTMLGILLLGAVSICIALLFQKEINEAKEEIFLLKEEVIEKNRQVTTLSEKRYLANEDISKQSQKEQRFSLQNETDKQKAVFEKRHLYGQYRLKFYLNAYHYILIDGSKGEIHPHTWQVMIQMVKKKEELILFNEIECRIEEFLSEYQDKTINDIPPFNMLNPILENMSEYFKNEIIAILNDAGWTLTSFECSETPTRSYLIQIPYEIQ